MKTRTLVWPLGPIISPGVHVAKVREVETIESWMFGELVETVTQTDEVFEVNVPEPRTGCRPFFWLDSIFGNFDECEHQGFTVIRDDDSTFWLPFTNKQEMVADIVQRNREKLAILAEQFGWELDENGDPLPPVLTFSKSDFETNNKKLMAHVVVDAGVFKSVGDAKRNGWDKPIETGDFCLTKKKIRFKVVD